MTIKSVREISFFQTLRDKELSFTFGNTKLHKTKDEILCFIDSLLNIMQKDIKEKQITNTLPIEEHYIADLAKKFENNIYKETEILNLTFIEAIHLHNILDYFENHYKSFTESVIQEGFSLNLHSYVENPSNFYNRIYDVKNDIEFKLGEMVTHSYKLKHK